MIIEKPRRTLTSYGVECLLRPQGVQGTEYTENMELNEITPVHEAQLLSYLKLSEKRLGLLINFNVVLFKDGITRRIN